MPDRSGRERSGQDGAFAAAAYDLEPLPGSSSVRLAALSADEARRLGEVFAAMEPWSRYPYPAHALETYFARVEPTAPRFGLHVDGALAGAVGLRLEWLRGPFLQLLGLVPGVQRRGLGSRTLAWMEAEARRTGERNLWVTVSQFNARAQQFYERAGFIEIAHLDDLVQTGHAEVLMRKALV